MDWRHVLINAVKKAEHKLGLFRCGVSKRYSTLLPLLVHGRFVVLFSRDL